MVSELQTVYRSGRLVMIAKVVPCGNFYASTQFLEEGLRAGS